MPTTSASDYTAFLKMKAASLAYASGQAPRPIQTVAQPVPTGSMLNAAITSSKFSQLNVQDAANLNATGSTSFSYTGGDQSFVVPAGVSALSVTLSGAGGQSGSGGTLASGKGGAGGKVTGTLPVQPNTTYTIMVGGTGGSTYGGGGAAGATGAGAGGGRTAISLGGVDLVVAGGGGGAGVAGTTGGAGGGGASVNFLTPRGITSDGAGNFYFCDSGNHVIKKMTTGGVMTIIAGTGSSGNSNGTGTGASFNTPTGIVWVNVSGTTPTLFVCDSGNHVIRSITLSNSSVATLAGAMGSPGTTTNVSGTSAQFRGPRGICSDGTNLYVGDTDNNQIRQIVISSAAVTTIAGDPGVSNGPGAIGNNAGTVAGASALFNQPYSGYVTGGYLYVADSGNNSIRQISTTSPYNTATYAGSVSGVAGDTTNASGTSARFTQPRAITGDGGTNLYVADFGNNVIRKIVMSGVGVTVLAGTGTAGYVDSPGTPQFNQPGGVVLYSGSVYLADTGNNAIRAVVTSSGSTSTISKVILGGTQTGGGTGGTNSGTAGTGGAGTSTKQSGGGGGGYYGGSGGATDNYAGGGGSSLSSNLLNGQSTVGAGAAADTAGAVTIAYVYNYKNAFIPRSIPQLRSNKLAKSTVSWVSGTSGSVGTYSSSATNTGVGLPAKNKVGTYTRDAHTALPSTLATGRYVPQPLGTLNPKNPNTST